MRRIVVVIAAVVMGLSVFGCQKKQSGLEEMQEPLSMEALSSVNTVNITAASETKIPEVKPQVIPSQATEGAKLEPLPPGGPYKPTTKEIQAALKNANFYTGEIDGKLGPKTKKAIEEFQKANNLKADGKVGPQTWAALSTHVTDTMVPAETSKKKAGTKKR